MPRTTLTCMNIPQKQLVSETTNCFFGNKFVCALVSINGKMQDFRAHYSLPRIYILSMNIEVLHITEAQTKKEWKHGAAFVANR